jgi:hypothetical protein
VSFLRLISLNILCGLFKFDSFVVGHLNFDAWICLMISFCSFGMFSDLGFVFYFLEGGC